MKQPKFLLFALATLVGCLSMNAQRKVSILGDSYSTYQGLISPNWNLSWYMTPETLDRSDNDVKSAEQTWWRQLIDNDSTLVLERNNSFSGATICCHGYRNEDFSDRAFLTRMHDLGNPDIILIFGGTNDSWAGAPVGDFKYEGWTKNDLYYFRPALAYMLSGMKALYPEALIVNITNSELRDDITASMAEICQYYQIPNLQLADVEKQSGHPSQEGMKAIVEQLRPYLK